MALFKIEDRYPDYKETLADNSNIMNAAVYAQTSDGSDKVGSVRTVLVDELDRLRYLVVDTGFWILGKKVLLPMGRCIDDPKRNRIYVTDLTKQQVEALPEYRDDLVVDDDYEEQVRSVYLMPSASVPGEQVAPVEQAVIEGNMQSIAPMPDARQALTDVGKGADLGDRSVDLYTMNDANHRRLCLYEEQLVTNKHRVKTGEVTVIKRIETEQTETSVPVKKEKVIIEIESAVGTTEIHTPADSFQNGEITQIDLHEEQATICKEPVVRQEVNIRKEIDQDTVMVSEELRREELDVQKEGSPEVVDQTL